MDVAIVTRQLSKTFSPPAGWRRVARVAKTAAVQDVSLTVFGGELFGLLGPNGAGKTTLVKVLCTLILPTSGSATVAGYPLAQAGGIRQSVGLVVSDERSFYWRLSGRRNLRFFAGLYRLSRQEADKRIDEVLADVDLLAEADRPFSAYSTGMRQRLAIARSMLHRPRILFLDEPSRSLDPMATARLHQLIRELVRRHGVTIFLVTHNLAEAEALCERTAVMHQGRIQVVGRPAELRRQLLQQVRYVLSLDGLDGATEERLHQLQPEASFERLDGRVQLRFRAAEDDGSLTAVIDCLRAGGVEIRDIDGQPPSLEEVFAHYTTGAPSAERT